MKSGEVVPCGVGVTGDTALVIEVCHGVIFLLIHQALTVDRGGFGILVAVGDDRAQPHKILCCDAASLCEHPVTSVGYHPPLFLINFDLRIYKREDL